MRYPSTLLQLPQGKRLLTLLRQRGERGVGVAEIITPRPEGLGIAVYTARIKELRDEGHNIINLKKNVYVLGE